MNTPYSNYIIPVSEIAKPFASDADSLIETVNANFSKHVGFKKLGIHHVTLPPGRRTSLPHAESLGQNRSKHESA